MTDYRDSISKSLNRLFAQSGDELARFMRSFVQPDVVWDVCFPLNCLNGIDAVMNEFVTPIRRSLDGVRRRDEIFIGSRNRHDGCEWIASLTHYVGNFNAPLFGIPPNNRLVLLRSGEFYRVDDGRIGEAKLILDLVDLLRQTGQSPIPHVLGNEMLYPGPATHDGVLPGNRDRGETSMQLINAMLADLHEYDPKTYSSAKQTGINGYWHEDMLWYGPGGIGSSYRWAGFQKDHRIPFLTAFPDREGGNRFCEFGDGDYAALGGWPAMSMTHKGEYLGVEPTGSKLTLRVMDFYRCADGKIAENWVLLDYMDLLDQMGVDVLAQVRGPDPTV
ncbi:MAG: ester cyclase [Gammaproteobacteria bacterium]|nr:ester cyclase [Gammaproteobacteria bacterium]